MAEVKVDINPGVFIRSILDKLRSNIRAVADGPDPGKSLSGWLVAARDDYVAAAKSHLARLAIATRRNLETLQAGFARQKDEARVLLENTLRNILSDLASRHDGEERALQEAKTRVRLHMLSLTGRGDTTIEDGDIFDAIITMGILALCVTLEILLNYSAVDYLSNREMAMAFTVGIPLLLTMFSRYAGENYAFLLSHAQAEREFTKSCPDGVDPETGRSLTLKPLNPRVRVIFNLCLRSWLFLGAAMLALRGYVAYQRSDPMEVMGTILLLVITLGFFIFKIWRGASYQKDEVREYFRLVQEAEDAQKRMDELEPSEQNERIAKAIGGYEGTICGLEKTVDDAQKVLREFVDAGRSVEAFNSLWPDAAKSAFGMLKADQSDVSYASDFLPVEFGEKELLEAIRSMMGNVPAIREGLANPAELVPAYWEGALKVARQRGATESMRTFALPSAWREEE